MFSKKILKLGLKLTKGLERFEENKKTKAVICVGKNKTIAKGKVNGEQIKQIFNAHEKLIVGCKNQSNLIAIKLAKNEVITTSSIN